MFNESNEKGRPHQLRNCSPLFVESTTLYLAMRTMKLIKMKHVNNDIFINVNIPQGQSGGKNVLQQYQMSG